MEILVNGKIKNITLYNLCRVDVAQECMEAAADVDLISYRDTTPEEKSNYGVDYAMSNLDYTILYYLVDMMQKRYDEEWRNS